MRGIKRVHPDLKVGGPACAGTAMALPFARWCRENKVPVDFLSTHYYPMDEYGKWPRREGSPHAPGQRFVDEFKNFRAALDAHGFAHLPNIVTEWNTQHCDENGKAKWVGTSDCSRLFSAAAALHYAVETDSYVDALGRAALPFTLQRDEVLFAELCPPRLGSALGTAETDAALAALDRALQYPGAV